jgi:hypothetical protein
MFQHDRMRASATQVDATGILCRPPGEVTP